MSSAIAPPATTTAATTVAQQLLQAIVTRDHAMLRGLLSDDVWLRAMLVREVLERHDADATVEAFRGWFGGAVELEVLHASTEPVATRQRITYRLRLRPEWAPDAWHVIEQTGYVRVQDGRIRRLDLVCTGFAPETDVHAHVGGG